MSTKRLLFAHAFFIVNDEKQLREKFQPYPPLATLYAASIARQAGYSVALFDAMLSSGMEEFTAALEADACDLLVIYEDDFNFLTKMCLTHVRDTTFEMIGLAVERGIPVIVHSSDASDRPGIYLDRGARYVISGEGEQTLEELLQYMFSPSRGKLSLPDGVIARGEDGLIAAPRRESARSIDHLPFPAWDLVDFARYREAWLERHGYFSINLVSSRGCPYQCNWCAKPIWGQQYVRFDPRYMARQIHWLKEFAQPDELWFSDDIFGLNRRWLKDFASAVVALDCVVPYKIQSRADLIDDTLAAILHRSGCREIWLGVESGSQRILDAMDKELTLDQVGTARESLRDVGIKTGFFIQLGYLGEDIADIEATRRMLIGLQPDNIGVSVSYPLPGTAFHDNVQSQIRDKTNWQQSNDLDTVFTTTFSADFYRRVRNHLHQELADRNSGGAAKVWEKRWKALIREANNYRQLSTTDIISRVS